MYELTISLDREQLDPETFAKAILAFIDLLKATDRNIARGKPQVRWQIARLSYASPALVGITGRTIRNAAADAVPVVGRAVLNSLRELEKGSRPAALSDTGLEKARTLAALASAKRPVRIVVSEIPESIREASESVYVSAQTAATVEKYIGAAYESYGVVQGRLEVLSSRQGIACVVHDSVTEKAVKCSVPDELKRVVIASFDEFVLARGRIQRDSSGFPRTMSLEGIEVLQAAPQLPQSLAGIAPGYTGNDDPVAYLRMRWE